MDITVHRPHPFTDFFQQIQRQTGVVTELSSWARPYVLALGESHHGPTHPRKGAAAVPNFGSDSQQQYGWVRVYTEGARRVQPNGACQHDEQCHRPTNSEDDNNAIVFHTGSSIYRLFVNGESLPEQSEPTVLQKLCCIAVPDPLVVPVTANTKIVLCTSEMPNNGADWRPLRYDGPLDEASSPRVKTFMSIS